jgi:hypothetical protein
MTAVVHQNHNPDCSTPQRALGGDFEVRNQRSSGAYWFITCRRCRLAWHCPKDERRRTREALAILRTHTREHRHLADGTYAPG